MSYSSNTTTVNVPITLNGTSITLQGHMQTEYITPDPIAKYLTEMEWYRMNHRWGNKELPNTYLTWEQAVVYCLVRPFFNPE
jgi:hypothetical protein